VAGPAFPRGREAQRRPTPECAAALTAMLDALGNKAGPEDTRTTSQRHHDALEEACRGWLPSCIVL
jgi:hypothetical protein